MQVLETLLITIQYFALVRIFVKEIKREPIHQVCDSNTFLCGEKCIISGILTAESWSSLGEENWDKYSHLFLKMTKNTSIYLRANAVVYICQWAQI